MKQSFQLLIIGILLVAQGFAQQEAMFTHYHFNMQSVNPAYAGSRQAMTITGIHRSQWVSFEGAPISQTITLHSPVLMKQLGAGLSIMNDKIGPIQMLTIFADVSYSVNVTDNSELRFGIKGGMNLMQIGLTELHLRDENDADFSKDINSKILPNFGFGMYYLAENYYLGVSSPKLLENDYLTNNSTGGLDVSSQARHYFLIGGAYLKLSSSIDLQPNALFKMTPGSPLQLDITAPFIFKEKIKAGAKFRTGDAVGVLVGYNITEQFQFGYSYDWSYGLNSFKYNFGSHEILLQYDFVFKTKLNKSVTTPRF